MRSGGARSPGRVAAGPAVSASIAGWAQAGGGREAEAAVATPERAAPRVAGSCWPGSPPHAPEAEGLRAATGELLGSRWPSSVGCCTRPGPSPQREAATTCRPGASVRTSHARRKDWGPAPADWGAAAADAAGHPRVSDAAASLSRARPRGESTSSDGRPRGGLSLPYPIGVSGSNRNDAFPEGRVRCRFPRLQAFAGSPSDPERHDGFC